jgi:hypothetical protein
MVTGRMGTRIAKYDGEKITQIREKYKVVFEIECLLDDEKLLEQFKLTDEGDLVMILR